MNARYLFKLKYLDAPRKRQNEMIENKIGGVKAIYNVYIQDYFTVIINRFTLKISGFILVIGRKEINIPVDFSTDKGIAQAKKQIAKAITKVCKIY